jgi:hypothetical protein
LVAEIEPATDGGATAATTPGSGHGIEDSAALSSDGAAAQISIKRTG